MTSSGFLRLKGPILIKTSLGYQRFMQPDARGDWALVVCTYMYVYYGSIKLHFRIYAKFLCLLCSITLKRKKEIWLGPTTKTHTPTENATEESDNPKTSLIISITQRLRTDWGRQVVLTTAIRLVWWNGFWGCQASHSPQWQSDQLMQDIYTTTIFISLYKDFNHDKNNISKSDQKLLIYEYIATIF